MSPKKTFQTVALIARQLRTYGPALAAIGQTKNKDARKVLFGQLADEIYQNDQTQQDILQVMANITNTNLETVDVVSAINLWREAWRVNRLDDAFLLAYNLDILSQSDIANLTWVLSNWRQHNGGSTIR